jgi:hypothetical protein
MDLASGFQIDSPNVFVPWGIREDELRSLLDAHGLKCVTHGYYTLPCVSLDGLSHQLGFHFYPRSGGILNELEFFRRSYESQEASFSEFQEHFEGALANRRTNNLAARGFHLSLGTFQAHKLSITCLIASGRKNTCASAKSKDETEQVLVHLPR